MLNRCTSILKGVALCCFSLLVPSSASAQPLYRLHLPEPTEPTEVKRLLADERLRFLVEIEAFDLSENGYGAGIINNSFPDLAKTHLARLRPVGDSFILEVIDLPSGLSGGGGWGSGGVNDAGHVVLGYRGQGFLWRGGGSFVGLGALPERTNPYSNAMDLNNTGLIVGASNEMPVYWKIQGAMATGPIALKGGEGEAYDVNDAGDIVGRVLGAAVIWKGAEATPLVLPDADGMPNAAGFALSISPNGIIAGSADQHAGINPLKWVPNGDGTAYAAQPLRPISGAEGSSVYGVNSDGLAVGMSGSRAVLWDSAGVSFDLNNLIHPDSAVPRLMLAKALEINDQGWIVGEAQMKQGVRAFILTPEGSALARSRPKPIEDLMTSLQATEPGTVLGALAELRGSGVDEGRLTLALREREAATKGFLAGLFEGGPKGVPEQDRSAAVLAAAEAVQPILEQGLKNDFDSSTEKLGSVLWALDTFPMQDASSRPEALQIRRRLVAALREVRPFQNAIAADIDHGGGDMEPWALIEGGVFRFGARPGQGEDLRPETQVAAFRILKHEVTNGEFARLFRQWDPAEEFKSRPWEEPEFPASRMVWQQAYVFAAWAGGPDAQGRLPTQAEWEYAARSGGLERNYPWGGSETAFCERAWVKGCVRGGVPSREGPLPACSLPGGNTDQNVCDMAGNVSEWTADLRETSLPIGDSPGGAARISLLRGGDFFSSIPSARVSSRSKHPNRWGASFDIGFRVVVAAPQPSLVAEGVLASRRRLEQIEGLLGYVRAAEPGAALESLAKLRSMGVDESLLTQALRDRERKSAGFLIRLFEHAPTAVAESERNAAVLAGAKAAQPILEQRLHWEVDESAQLLGWILWTLDAYPMRDKSTQAEAREIRSRLVAALREVRPFQDAIASDIDHGKGDFEPWAMIEGGTFRLGEKPDWGKDRRPEIQVGSFRILKHEVTYGEFARLFPRFPGSCCSTPQRYPKHPVAGTSWWQAYVFAAWSGGPKALGRLPTDAEWEYAARSRGLERDFPWGDSAADLCERAWVQGCERDGSSSGQSSLPVCSLPHGNTDQNVCDMAGNVSEITAGQWPSPSVARLVRGGPARFRLPGSPSSGGVRVVVPADPPPSN